MTRWSLFLQTLSLLHHFLGLYLGETDDFKASDFVREIIRYLGGPNLDWALVNTRDVSETVRQAYLGESAYPVESDLDLVQRHAPGVFATSLGNNQVPLIHGPERIAEAVLSIASIGRVRGGFKSDNGHKAAVPAAGRSVAMSRRRK